jgi:hypothetical protein
MMLRAGNSKGFLLIDTLIAGLILTASVAATMYLFRVGLENLGRANDANILSSKVPTIIHLARTLDPTLGSGKEDLGDGVVAEWQIRLVGQRRIDLDPEGGRSSVSETSLYKVTFNLSYKGTTRSYETYTLHWKKGASQQKA